MKLLLVLGICLSSVVSAQELPFGDVFRPQEVYKLMNSSYPSLKNPNCLKDHIKTADYLDRLKEGGHIREVNVCSEGKNLRFNIRYNQMGGARGSMPSVNWIVYCDLKKEVAKEGCRRND